MSRIAECIPTCICIIVKITHCTTNDLVTNLKIQLLTSYVRCILSELAKRIHF